MIHIAKNIRLTRIAKVRVKDVMVVFFDWDNKTTYTGSGDETRIVFSVGFINGGAIDVGQSSTRESTFENKFAI